MKERPILFSGPMVKAILDGTKTQTRRIMKPAPSGYATTIMMHPLGHAEFFRAHRCLDIVRCPYGKPGDRLWVRETHRFPDWDKIEYRADNMVYHVQDNGEWLREKDIGQKWKPSIFLPRWASRITLEVVNVRVERLQDISEEDAMAEGVEREDFPFNPWMNYEASIYQLNTARESFLSLWESINGPGSWEANPWVWVVEFKRITP